MCVYMHLNKLGTNGTHTWDVVIFSGLKATSWKLPQHLTEQDGRLQTEQYSCLECWCSAGPSRERQKIL